MRATKRRRTDPHEQTVGLLPVMSVMFLLIPGLLLAMEVAAFAAIDVRPPSWTHGPAEPMPPPSARLRLRVTVLGDGFNVDASGQRHGGPAGFDTFSETVSVPLIGPPTAELLDRLDYARLESLAAEYKLGYPDATTVTVSAEANVPLAAIVRTLDAMRGSACNNDLIASGHDPLLRCRFHHALIEAGPGRVE